MTDTNIKEVSGKIPPYFKAHCTCRVLKAEFKVSDSSGKPRIDLTCEIVDPLEILEGGTLYKDLNKRTFKIMLMLSTEKNGLENTKEFMRKHELPDDIDPNNPSTDIFKGLVFNVVQGSAEKFFTKYNPATKTNEFIKDGSGNKISEGFEWTVTMYNSMSASAFTGLDRRDWSHLSPAV